MTKSVFHIILDEFWPTLLYDGASVNWHLQAFFNALKVPPQYFESGSGLDLGCAIASTWFFNPSNLYLVLCLGSLSCWMTHPGFRRQSDGRRFYYRILWYTKEFDSVTERCLRHTAEKQAHPITPPLPCLAASKVLVLNYCICFLPLIFD